jgi:hypothetical protein
MLQYTPHTVSLSLTHMHTFTQLKDLKRQLAHMQKREEKRQEQLSELTTGGEGYGAGHEQSTDNLSKHSRSVSY